MSTGYLLRGSQDADAPGKAGQNGPMVTSAAGGHGFDMMRLRATWEIFFRQRYQQKSLNGTLPAALSAVFLLAMAAGMSAMADQAEFMSPKRQLAAGVAPEDVRCNADRVLVIRDGGSPACVTEATPRGSDGRLFLAQTVDEPEAKPPVEVSKDAPPVVGDDPVQEAEPPVLPDLNSANYLELVPVGNLTSVIYVHPEGRNGSCREDLRVCRGRPDGMQDEQLPGAHMLDREGGHHLSHAGRYDHRVRLLAYPGGAVVSFDEGMEAARSLLREFGIPANGSMFELHNPTPYGKLAVQIRPDDR